MTTEEKICFNSEDLPTFTERGFQPILATFCSVLEKQQLDPIEIIEGKSIKPLSDGVDKPFLKGFFKPYKMGKCEKICLCNCILMNKILTSAVIAIPQDGYDFPMLVLEYSETDNTISVVVDFVPMVDLVMYEDYRTKYLDHLDQYWTKYNALKGMAPNRFAWTRMMFSPYYLSGAVPKENEQNIKDCLDIIKNYFHLWMELHEKAEPLEDEKAKEYVKARKAQIRKIFRANDEGAKSMVQMVGSEIIELLLLCSF